MQIFRVSNYQFLQLGRVEFNHQVLPLYSNGSYMKAYLPRGDCLK